ncbi:MAG: ABC transporter substrate-binding protein [Meiothermus sp.]|uniref:ABC transporter substrate-binding protein n=1 Tax=Meiothermus sp. TaxID=1955249 RepID=UPI0025F804BC|nr:ABC transporter substrate-binding protein [Meiothermus sp.]MCS7058964.1 ABC transporter substrate-binding protein [Meiothermus sp.]MCS7195606.1 ABC transporter substrate-binding protein [Meiothermus sp.]MCX7741240.1 ABC transporter substrate-binding protein [Meiothermus sp.]MDW8091480.1 ABC transporter substrate-binding protein [Meiothermus sp.]MDW8480319.1 ABC transporter substrate-binding protein [Meiothermus sp.]
MRKILLLVFGLVLLLGMAFAQQRRVVLAVGGKTAVVYLPLTLVERLGYFQQEGLEVVIQDLQAGSRALAALNGGSADVVMGFYDHTIQMQAQGRDITAFVEVGRYPGVVLGVRTDLERVQGIADLKGMRVGVTAPGSSTNFYLNHWLIKAGLRPTDVAVIGVGTGAQAVAAVERRQIDAIVNVDPAITLLQRRGLIRVLADTRTAQGARAVFGGEYPAAVLYTTRGWLERNPETAQKLVNAMVRGLRWMQGKSAEEIARVLPEEYFLGDRELYLQVLRNSTEMFSKTGRFSDSAPLRPLVVLSGFDEAVARSQIDLKKTYTNAFVDRVPKP